MARRTLASAVALGLVAAVRPERTLLAAMAEQGGLAAVVALVAAQPAEPRQPVERAELVALLM